MKHDNKISYISDNREGIRAPKRSILKIIRMSLLLLLLIAMVKLVLFPLLKMGLHLDFSQDYRQMEAADQLRFWDRWNEKVYIRYALGLRPIEKRKDVPEEEKPALSWLDTDIYDVTAAGDRAAWYDWKESKIFLGTVEGEVQESFDLMYDGKELAFSPDGKYLLVYEINYRGEITDDEYCYYRVIDLGEGTQYTVYSGYREWFQVYWADY